MKPSLRPHLALLLGLLTLWGCSPDFEALDARACQSDRECTPGVCLYGYCQTIDTPDAQDDASGSDAAADADQEPDPDLTMDLAMDQGGDDGQADIEEDTNDIEDIAIQGDVDTPDIAPDMGGDAEVDAEADLPEDLSTADMPADLPEDEGGDVEPEDQCPDDPLKTEAGLCGCGVIEDTGDGDGDALINCLDGCPDDPDKTEPGLCGCGAPEADRDGDQTPDCVDECPDNAGKIAPGVCGCEVSDDDTDGDQVLDCADNCPTLSNPTQADIDDDGIGNLCDPDNRPQGIPRDVTGDGRADLAYTLPITRQVQVIAGAADMQTSGNNFTNPALSFTWSQGTDDSLEVVVENFGDLNGDGLSDPVVGFPERGEVLIYYTPLTSNQPASQRLSGPPGFGRVVNTRGDFNNDGLRDLVVTTQGGEDRGVTVFYGAMGGIIEETQQALTLPNPTRPFPFPLSVAAASGMQNNHFDALLVGGGDIDGGEVYVWYGGANELSEPIRLLTSATPYFGVSMSTRGGEDDSSTDILVVSGYWSPSIYATWLPGIFRHSVTFSYSNAPEIPTNYGWFGLSVVAFPNTLPNEQFAVASSGNILSTALILMPTRITNINQIQFGVSEATPVEGLDCPYMSTNITHIADAGDLDGNGINDLAFGLPECDIFGVGYMSSDYMISYTVAIPTEGTGLGASIGHGHGVPAVTARPTTP